jgi:hypothetical protein
MKTKSLIHTLQIMNTMIWLKETVRLIANIFVSCTRTAHIFVSTFLFCSHTVHKVYTILFEFLCPAHAQYTCCWGTAHVLTKYNVAPGSGSEDGGSAPGDKQRRSDSAASCEAPTKEPKNLLPAEEIVLQSFQQINNDLGSSSIVSEASKQLLSDLSAAPREPRNSAEFVLDPAQLDKEPVQRSKSLGQVFKTGSEFSIFKFIEQQRLSTLAANKLIKTITKVIYICVCVVLVLYVSCCCPVWQCDDNVCAVHKQHS